MSNGSGGEPAPGVVRRELDAEQRYVDNVYAHLAHAARSAQQVAAESRNLYQSDRTTFMREEDGTAMFERDAFAYQAARRLAVLDAEHEGLVFGRLDHTDGEVRYIGRIGVRDDEYEPLVIDWRARAAEPFYRATPNDPMTVVRRRVLRSRSERVIGIEDDLLDSSARHDLVIVGEGALMAALKRARGPQMRDIVATIQAEQDEAIRAPYQGVTFISGGPGTGKTVVALHRTAYLLYSNRRRFENGGVLVVGPSAIFMNYIERVLPSLGEDQVTLHAIGGVASDVLGFRAERVDDALAATVKGSLRMLDVLRRLVDEPLGQVPELRVTVKGVVLALSTARLDSIRRHVLAGHQLNRGRTIAERDVLAALHEQLPDEVELEADQFSELVTDQAAYRMFLHAWWPSLTPSEVLGRLADIEIVESVAGDTLNPTEREALAASYRAGDFSVADTALLDELLHLLGRPLVEDDADIPLFLDADASVEEIVTTYDRYNAGSSGPDHDPDDEPHATYAHILVDEAQDITPMQWRMLRRRGSQASWTIVGDPAQSSWPDADEAREAVDQLVGRAPNRRFRLSVNYRSPAEVFELAGRVVRRAYPDADLPTAVRSTGVDPQLRTLGDADVACAVDSIVAELAGQVEGTIGIVVPRGRFASLARDLDGRPGMAVAGERVSLVNPLDVKGLEYDAVLVVAPDEIVAESPGGIRVLYVALTRPTQRLVTLDLSDSPGAWRESLG